MKVELYVYDLSLGLCAQLSSAFMGKRIEGIWHTGVVVYGREYFFGGSGIESCPPGGTVMGRPYRVHELGETHIPLDVFQDHLVELKQKFNPGTYELFTNNCNSFSNELSQFLTGNPVPDYIANLTEEILSTPFGASLRPFMEKMRDTMLPNDKEGNHSTDLEQPSSTTYSTSTTNPTGIATATTTATTTGTTTGTAIGRSTGTTTATSTGRSTGTRTGTSTGTTTGLNISIPGQSSGSTVGSFPEADVSRIVGCGFTRSEALNELNVYSGNTDLALATLFAKQFKF